MKRIFLLVCVGLVSTQLFAQDFKLFESKRYSGGFGGFGFGYFDTKQLYMFGEGVGVFRNFYVGGFGHAIELGEFQSSEDGLNYKVDRNGGGLILGLVSNPTQVFALYGEARLGADLIDTEPLFSGGSPLSIEQSAFSIQPTFGIAIRPTSYIQMRIFAGYTFINIDNLISFEGVPLSGENFGLGLSFGNF